MKTTLTFEFDDEKDQQEDFNSHAHGPKLALCIWNIQQRVSKEWENCDEGSEMEKLIEDVNNIIENDIGNLEDYTY